MSAHHPNYYHWIHDGLLRLSRTADGQPEETKFIVSPDLRCYQHEALKHFGIRDSQPSCFDGNEIWELASLYFSSHTKRPSHDLPDEVNWFRGRMLTACEITSSGGNRRIFISRRLADCRKITNESEVQSCLQEYGFETFDLEKVSFRDQVNLFAEAEIILSTHGPGLTNILFAPPGAHVVEILESCVLRNVYWSLSDALGLQYWYFLGETVPNAEKKLSDPIVHVPFEKLRWTLERVLAAPVGDTPRN